MAKIYVGSDGSYLSAWQLWKRRNHEPKSFILSYKDTVVFQPSNPEDDEYVWYAGVNEEELPDWVTLEGVTVRNDRH